MYVCNKSQQMRTFLINDLIIVSSTNIEQPSVHLQEDLYMQFYGISFMRPYKESGRVPVFLFKFLIL